ncbi:MAG: hypothetical protein IH822_03060 [Chloroflexi bacterium]|nr:hypothetical protein [Chloroflexota bacterium]
MDSNSVERIATGKPQVALEPCPTDGSCLHNCSDPLATHLVVGVGEYAVVVTLAPAALVSLQEVVEKMLDRFVKL